MKIAWFTPFHNESAIGRYSKFSTETLSRLMDIDIFAYRSKNASEEAAMHSTFVKVIYYSSPLIAEQLSEYDLCVYNMGDNLKYHGVIYDILKKRPGVVIAHDICMHNFIRGYYLVYKNSPHKYVELLQKQYGDDADFILKAANSIEEWQKLDLLKYNLSEEIYSNALGVVVHSNYHEKYLKEIYQGPVLVTPLLDMHEWKEVDETYDFKGLDKEKINILTVGVVNPNKHVDAVIEALGKNKEFRDKIAYTVIGSLGNEEYVAKLNRLIKKYELNNSVKLLGYVSDEELLYYYYYADIISNLRYPALEGGSASLVEQMLAGKGTIVTNTGVYAEIPDNCICKINANTMVNDLTALFRKLTNDKDMLQTYGKHAREYAIERFDREKYGENLKNFLDSVLFTLPIYEVIEKCDVSLACMKNTKMKNILADELENLYR